MKHDYKGLKEKIDLLSFFHPSLTHLVKVAKTKYGAEYAGACPICKKMGDGGRDRFRVQPYYPRGGRWLCRYCVDGHWHDIFAFVMKMYPNIENAGDAYRFLKNDYGSEPLTVEEVKKYHDVNSQVAIDAWQRSGLRIMDKFHHSIWTASGKPGLDYLHGRGLNDETIRKYMLGFNTKTTREDGCNWGLEKEVFLPAGIYIPSFQVVDQKTLLYNIKIRRMTKGTENRYLSVSGGKSALFGCENLKDKEIIVFCEGEFDCMTLDQEAGDLIGVATLGSATSTLNTRQYGYYFLHARTVFLALDSDDAGAKGINKLKLLSTLMVPLRIPVLRPGDKDINDYFCAGGNVRRWVEYVIHNACQ